MSDLSQGDESAFIFSGLLSRMDKACPALAEKRIHSNFIVNSYYLNCLICSISDYRHNLVVLGINLTWEEIGLL